jgi:aminoglycoside phosphotransferase (APT) family kinase protein
MQARLEAWLSDRVGHPVTVTGLRRVSSVGNAREPWAFRAVWDGGTHDCVMLVKAAAGQLETTLGPEYATIAGLAGSGVPVPAALWIDPDGEAFGSPFFVTALVPGVADTRALRRPDDPEVRAVAMQLAAAAARLHAQDPAHFGHLPPATCEDAASQQLAYWDELFRRQRLEAHPGLVYVVRWLTERRPVAQRVSVVHGDLRFGNLLADGSTLTALLDWEMTHLGDPVEDLGWVYRALWSPARSLPFDEFLAAYGAAGGSVPEREHLRWYEVFNELKHSVISLTGVRSFAERSSTSLRHADRAATVPAFVRRSLELIGEAPC